MKNMANVCSEKLQYCAFISDKYIISLIFIQKFTSVTYSKRQLHSNDVGNLIGTLRMTFFFITRCQVIKPIK